MAMSDRLAGKVAIVTGSGTREGDGVGVGRAMAVRFAREGARVLVVDIEMANAEETVTALEDEGFQGSAFEADVSAESACEGMVAAAVDRYGKLDTLVNSVGIGGRGKVTEVDEAEWDRVVDVDMKSCAMASKHAIPAMVEAGGGSITNIASIDGIKAGSWPNIPYAAAKGGMIAMTRNMAVQHGRDGVRVNCIAPGHIYTPMVSGILTEETRKRRASAGPLGTEGTAWDVAWACSWQVTRRGGLRVWCCRSMRGRSPRILCRCTIRFGKERVEIRKLPY